MSHKPSKGRTPHIYADGFIYFLTARTANAEHILTTRKKKLIFVQVWNNLQKEYHVTAYHWILWSNHYHFLVHIPNGEHLHRLMNRLHSVTAMKMNELDGKKGRKVWQQYWDHCIRNEVDFWRHFNYITNNPIKHGWCVDLEQAAAYPYCGNRQWVEKRGSDFLFNLLCDYPVKDFEPEDERSSMRFLLGGKDV